MEVGKGQSFFPKEGRIGKTGFRKMPNTILFGDDWEERIRQFADKHPNSQMVWELGNNKYQTQYQPFGTDEFGTNMMIAQIAEYREQQGWTDDDGFSLFLENSPSLKKRILAHKRSSNDTKTAAKRNRRANKRGMRTGRGK